MSRELIHTMAVPVLGICAYSGTGKTTLLTALIPWLKKQGIRVAVIKHAHHNFDVDKPGKDSFLLRQAGAQQLLIASEVRYAHMYENLQTESPDLPSLLARIDCDSVDLILVEGFKHVAFDKIELYRQSVGAPLIYPNDDNVVAIASCQQSALDSNQLATNITQLSLDDIEQIGRFILSHTKLTSTAAEKSSCGALPAGTLSVEQAVTAIEAQTKRLQNIETLALERCLGYVLAENIYSTINVPQHTNSAMDGYAIHAPTLHQSKNSQQLSVYDIVGEVFAGQLFSDLLQPGQAVRIMTGAPLPEGANSVIAKELATEDISGDTVQVSFSDMGKLGQNIRQFGEDITKGELAVAEGERLNAARLGLLASLGFANLKVTSAPTIALFSTGNEVSQPGQKLQKAGIYDANRYSVMALAQQLNCNIIDFGIIEDNQQSLQDTLVKASQQADIIISSGGVSVGDADFVKDSINAVGNVDFWRVQMRPGRPLAFGKLHDALFFGLPGNPVAAMICFMVFVQPAIRKMTGEQNWQQPLFAAIASCSMRSRLGRHEYLRGCYSLSDDGQLHVALTGPQGSGILTSMVQANCIIVLPPETESVKQGDKVNIMFIADLL
ncbi:bifunctional molybdopterin-guanine dinucleotide biosynthesis adaptor protein MobB/molybdopterin molybdotransferase MoeA [Thalassotalea sp. Y01]|uniref:bifunctional molybdopterin-guanine dinucleotide biosynthesis adaptor protein MobB/molybdopterin molybdotransferase MoeA n=1 Tax=Thalassotalea sp. Y01 TaxID=2729613 RepID=UPI00145C5D98|nr:bifunctional molybdopterin-guanine dinucleotide biosynthesis adaptor protein MobB/molybdopterin molybdotransferase MoeA [Thalassotalea sp. Y01]NMP17269.1 bifunctional molybdopterin-guanine dinucleotide biosynthesis adaptor protein MobB/molybdopterin molybdotransferase MoeA [Thalassotalea sp. Y01]